MKPLAIAQVLNVIKSEIKFAQSLNTQLHDQSVKETLSPPQLHLY